MKITINKQQILFIVVLIILLVGFFYFGAYTACDGKLINGFKCGEIEIIRACETINGDLYRLPENMTGSFV